MLVIGDPLLKFEIVFGAYFGRGCIGVAQGIIEFQCLLHGSFGLWNRNLRGGSAVVWEKQIRIGQADIGARVIWIFGYGLIEILDGFAKVRARSFVPKEPAFEVKLMSFGIVGWLFCYRD